jgi:peptidyl-tRNA hydrolase
VEDLLAEKLFLVTRLDLPLGQQAVQACHAMTEFLVEHKERAIQWHSTSNTLALLVVPDENNLLRLAVKASRRGVRFSLFREPDRANELTAIAFEPRAKSLLNDLPLAFGV